MKTGWDSGRKDEWKSLCGYDVALEMHDTIECPFLTMMNREDICYHHVKDMLDSNADKLS